MWKEAEPEKGLICSVCKEELAVEHSHTFEIIPERSDTCLELLLYPYLGVFVMNYAIFLFDNNEDFLLTQIGNILFTIWYLEKMWSNFLVQNKDLYKSLWFQKNGHLLLAAHLMILSFFPHSPGFTLLSNSCMLPLHVHTHLFVLHAINNSIEIVFVSRRSS
jgi:hypothetical protein